MQNRAKLQELKRQVQLEGATKVARDLKAMLETEPGYGENFQFSDLANALITRKGNDKEVCGEEYVRDVQADASLVDIANLAHVTGQLYFNAYTTSYNAAEFTLKNRFRKIPSTLTEGERFGGLGNFSALTTPVNPNSSLPWVTPSEDYIQAPAQRWFGGIFGLTRQMLWNDRTGQINDLWSRLGEAAGQAEEMEAASTLTGIDFNSTSGASYTRTRHNWKGTPYDTYQSSTPWINLQTSNGLVDWNNINTSYLLLANQTDPWTQMPLTRMGNRLTLIVPQDLTFVASRIKHTLQFRTGTASTNNSILLSGGPSDTFDQQELEVVESRYLRKVLSDNSLATTTWYLGYPEQAFSWQSAMSITPSDAVQNSGELFTRSMVSAHKVEYWNTSFVFQPRFMVKTTA